MSKILKNGVILMVLGFAACTCSTEQAIQKVLGVGMETPVFLGVKALSAHVIRFDFSNPVKVSSINFTPPLETQSINEGTAVMVNLKEAMGDGEWFVADLLVEDERGNTLGVLLPFYSRNERIPGLLITELRTEYSSNKDPLKARVEFVEMKTLSAGNLGAIRLFTAVTSMTEPVFIFPPTEVAAGEYLVLHLRTLDPGMEAFPDARNFWVPEAIKRLRKTDAVLLMDQDDTVLDGVLLSETSDSSWAKKDGMNQAAALLAAQKAWLSADGSNQNLGPPDAVLSKGTTATRTICRDETAADTNSAADWYITDTSNASPGKPNSVKRYVPKS
ncbi:hypothetical protein AGMMS49940_15680 [Spirochaetia bacterium]|nr:hypothetical protein AGMMS49940_15680 [Spirochaetia bacterium]